MMRRYNCLSLNDANVKKNTIVFQFVCLLFQTLSAAWALFFLCTPLAGRWPAAGGWLYLSPLWFVVSAVLLDRFNGDRGGTNDLERHELFFSMRWAGFCWGGLSVVLCCWWCPLLRDESFAAATDVGLLGVPKPPNATCFGLFQPSDPVVFFNATFFVVFLPFLQARLLVKIEFVR